ncbi:MAG: DUF1343 domain-containing protein [Pseudomonadota bacterium]
MVTTGLENLILNPPAYLIGRRLGLLCNPASVDSSFNHASRMINKHFPGQLKVLFSPQHGYYAEKQDNMIESHHFLEPFLNIPVYSLYGETRIPTVHMFDNIDVLIVDIQDVGTRVYTFIYTVSYCLEIAARLKKQVVILDRPNPVGGLQIEGNLLSKEFSSFVGRYEIPMRHGMTIGEICSFFNTRHQIGCDLRIIPMTGWKRSMYWRDTGLPWVAPSPNLPTPESAMVYPGQVIFEGTNVSEGRGTTQPFEIFGAPYINCEQILQDVQNKLPGLHLRPVSFEPTSGKWQGSICNGFQIHILSKQTYQPYYASLLLLQSIMRHHKQDFAYKMPPYEYEYIKMPIDLILGSKWLRLQIESFEDISQILAQQQPELDQFRQLTRAVYQYDE